MGLFPWLKKRLRLQPTLPTLGIDLDASRLRAFSGTQPIFFSEQQLAIPALVFRSQPCVAGMDTVRFLRRDPRRLWEAFLPLLHDDNPDAKEAWLAYSQLVEREVPKSSDLIVGMPADWPEACRTILQQTWKTQPLAEKLLPLPADLLLVHHRLPLGEPTTQRADHTLLAIIGVDRAVLRVSLVQYWGGGIQRLNKQTWSAFREPVWYDHLLNAIADRCVRLCRRDPRDNAEAEQQLFEQLEPALEAIRQDRKVTLGVRGDNWYQDVLLTPEDVRLLARQLLRPATESLSEWLFRNSPKRPPAEIWFTAEAARLPGIISELHTRLPESTRMRVLPPEAIAQAADHLASRNVPVTWVDTEWRYPELQGGLVNHNRAQESRLPTETAQ